MSRKEEKGKGREEGRIGNEGGGERANGRRERRQELKGEGVKR